MNENEIRKYLRIILAEEKEAENAEKDKKPEPKDEFPGVVLSVGRGRFRREVQEAGALAKENPEKLMANLNIKSGGADLPGIIAILKQAVSGTPAMKQAYGGLSTVSSGDKEGVRVKMGELNARNGAKFLHHTLVGAQEAGLYNSQLPTQIQVMGDEIMVYNAAKRNSWESPEKQEKE